MTKYAEVLLRKYAQDLLYTIAAYRYFY